jgi:hypothetical protein
MLSANDSLLLLYVAGTKKGVWDALCFKDGGEGGIRTLDTLPYTHFPGVRLRPLGHLSVGAEFSKLMPALHTSNSEPGAQKEVPISRVKWNFSEDCGPFKSR